MFMSNFGSYIEVNSKRVLDLFDVYGADVSFLIWLALQSDEDGECSIYENQIYSRFGRFGKSRYKKISKGLTEKGILRISKSGRLINFKIYMEDLIRVNEGAVK